MQQKLNDCGEPYENVRQKGKRKLDSWDELTKLLENPQFTKIHRRNKISKCLQDSSKNWLFPPICCSTEGTQGHLVSVGGSPIKGQSTLIACEIFLKVNAETPMLSTWERITPAGSYKASIVASSTSFDSHRCHRGGCFAVWEGLFIIMTDQGGNQTEWRYSHEGPHFCSVLKVLVYYRTLKENK